MLLEAKARAQAPAGAPADVGIDAGASAGAARARQQALRQGLAGAGVVRPEAETARVARRVEDWRATFPPEDAFQEWVLGQAVQQSVRLERCVNLDIAQRGLVVERAATLWDVDRTLAAEQTAQRLPRRPALVVAELKRTRHGCDWLLARWQALRSALAANGSLSEAERSRALDLLGVAPEERPFDGRLPVGDPTAQQACVQAQIEALEALKADVLDDLDQTEQALTAAGLSFDCSLPARLLRRFEAACQRAMDWALGQLLKLRRAPAAPATAPAAPRPPRSAAAPELKQIERTRKLLTALRPQAPAPPPAAKPAPQAAASRPLSPEALPLDDILTASSAPRPADALSLLTAAPMNRKDRRALRRVQRGTA